jgi:hypothetical protein
LASAALIAPPALADKPDATPSKDKKPTKGTPNPDPADDPLALIQTFPSKQFGNLLAPLGWLVEDTPDGVTLTQPRPTSDPSGPAAFIELARIRPPDGLGTQAVLDGLREELRAQHGPLQVLQQKAVAVEKHKGMLLDCTLTEGDHPTRYLVFLLNVRDEMLLAAIGAPPDHFDSLEPAKLLPNIIVNLDAL